MKAILTAILITATCFTYTFAQNSKYHFAKQAFKKHYKKQSFGRFNGQVVQVMENTFRYGDKVLIVEADNRRLLAIFRTGIFHPDIINNRPATKPLTKVQLDTLTATEQVLYNMGRNDSTTIGSLEQLEKLNPNSKTKRFVFWLFNMGVMNPTECYFELYNEKGTAGMPIEEFIKNSKLTFYYRGTIII